MTRQGCPGALSLYQRAEMLMHHAREMLKRRTGLTPYASAPRC